MLSSFGAFEQSRTSNTSSASNFTLFQVVATRVPNLLHLQLGGPGVCYIHEPIAKLPALETVSLRDDPFLEIEGVRHVVESLRSEPGWTSFRSLEIVNCSMIALADLHGLLPEDKINFSETLIPINLAHDPEYDSEPEFIAKGYVPWTLRNYYNEDQWKFRGDGEVQSDANDGANVEVGGQESDGSNDCDVEDAAMLDEHDESSDESGGETVVIWPGEDSEDLEWELMRRTRENKDRIDALRPPLQPTKPLHELGRTLIPLFQPPT